MLTPSADTPGNLWRLAENEELKESLQIMEHLMDHSALGSQRDYRCYPPQYGDLYYHELRPQHQGTTRNAELPNAKRQEMGYSQPPVGVNLSQGPRGNMTLLRRIQRADGEGEDVPSTIGQPLSKDRWRTGSGEPKSYNWKLVEDFWTNGPFRTNPVVEQPLSTPGWVSDLCEDDPQELSMVPPVQLAVVHSTVESSVPPPSLPSLDPEQMVPMQLARPGIVNVIPDHLPHGTVQVTLLPQEQGKLAAPPVVT